MISWIQHHLVRHGRWIFLILLGVIIVAFVFTIGNTPGCTNHRNAYEAFDFYGYDLNSRHEMQFIGRKLNISNQLNRSQIQNEQQYKGLITGRIALLHFADQIGLPVPDQAAIQEFIQSRQAFLDSDAQYSRDAMIRFIDTIEIQYPAEGQDLLLAVLEEDYRIEKLAEALAGPDYLLPVEALHWTQRNQTELKIATASLSYTTFEPEIETDEADLKTYYENNSDRYEIGERIDASYITFVADNYLDQVKEATEIELREHFIENRARLVAQYEATQDTSEAEETEEATEKPETQFEDVRDAFVIPEFKQKQASHLANQAAQDFAYRLYRNSVELDSDTFNALINQKGLLLKQIEPFTAKNAHEQKLPHPMLESAFALNRSNYYSDPYPVGEDYAILFFRNRMVSHLPPYEEVSDEVKTDFEIEEKRRLFNDEGERIKSALEAAIQTDKSFTDAATELKLKVEEFDAFTPTEYPLHLDPSIPQTAQDMEGGEVSSMIRSGDTGFFIYLESKKIPEITDENEDFEKTRESLSIYGTSIRRNALVNELVATGLPRSE